MRLAAGQVAEARARARRCRDPAGRSRRRKPWHPPKPQEITGQDDTETPGVEAVTQDGREYLAVWAQGMDNGSALSKPRQVVEVDIVADIRPGR